ncbi:MAG TPA: flavoprotein, partial [Gemmatimonadales bacterium]
MLAVTGASGAPYAVRLLEQLAQQALPVWLIVSTHGWRLLEQECGITGPDQLRAA